MPAAPSPKRSRPRVGCLGWTAIAVLVLVAWYIAEQEFTGWRDQQARDDRTAELELARSSHAPLADAFADVISEHDLVPTTDEAFYFSAPYFRDDDPPLPEDCAYDFTCMWVKVISVRDCDLVTGTLTSLRRLGADDETSHVYQDDVDAGEVFLITVPGTDRIREPDLTCHQ